MRSNVNVSFENFQDVLYIPTCTYHLSSLQAYISIITTLFVVANYSPGYINVCTSFHIVAVIWDDVMMLRIYLPMCYMGWQRGWSRGLDLLSSSINTGFVYIGYVL